MDTFRILGPTTVAYLDIFGSGVETIAHLKENGRIVVMFCAFQGAPKILRLHGQGRVVEPHEPGFALVREEGPGRSMNYTISSYAAQRPEGERY